MRKSFAGLFFLFLAGVAFGDAGDVTVIAPISPKNGAFQYVVRSTNVFVSTSSFSKNLTTSDANLQHAMETIDQLSASGGGYALQPATVTIQAAQGLSVSTVVVTGLSAGVVHVVTGSSAVVTGLVSISTETNLTVTSGLLLNASQLGINFSSAASQADLANYLTTASAAATYFQPANATTSNLPEGTRLYFTTGRSTAAVSATSPVIDTNGVFSVDATSVTLQGNTFNSGSHLLQLSSGLVPNANIDSSSVTKQGLLLAGSGITLSGSGGTTTIAASGGGGSAFFSQSFGAAQAKLTTTPPFLSNAVLETAPSLYFDEASTEAVQWTTPMTNYGGAQLFADIVFITTATAGTVQWEVYTSTQNPNSMTSSFDSPSFSVAVTTSVTTASSSLALQKATVTLSNTVVTSSATVTTFKLERGAAVDTAAGYARVLYLNVRESH